jgi:hypothetical protein
MFLRLVASRLSLVCPFAAALSLLAGCGSSGSPAGGTSISGAAGGSSPADGGPGDAAAMGAAGSTGTTSPTVVAGGAATNGTAAIPAANATAPGKYVTASTTPGAGPCTGVTLASLLEQIRAANPTLADITTVYNPAPTASGGDGSFIYPYARADGGFDIVFKRGLGDCPAGCTDNAYQYFATDAACAPVAVGHYHATWGTQNCLTVDGTPMWNHPPPPDPLTVCGQDNTPRDLRGTYLLHASGQRQPCSATPAKAATIDTTVSLLIEQDAKDLASGFVTFSGTGHALVDGVRLPARFQRRRFDAALQSSNLPSACPREQSVTSRYDFENYQPGGIEVTESGNDACAVCKGSMSLTLTSTTLTQAP